MHAWLSSRLQRAIAAKDALIKDLRSKHAQLMETTAIASSRDAAEASASSSLGPTSDIATLSAADLRTRSVGISF